MRNRAKIFCHVHPTEESRAFCATCDVSICHYCDEHTKCKQIGIRDAIFQKTTGHWSLRLQSFVPIRFTKYFFNLIFFLINQKDFEAILADVHRRAEVLRAEVHHMKRLKEQLLNEKTRCLSQIKDVAQGN